MNKSFPEKWLIVRSGDFAIEKRRSRQIAGAAKNGPLTD
jgi:hypothetical protein